MNYSMDFHLSFISLFRYMLHASFLITEYLLGVRDDLGKLHIYLYIKLKLNWDLQRNFHEYFKGILSCRKLLIVLSLRILIESDDFAETNTFWFLDIVHRIFDINFNLNWSEGFDCIILNKFIFAFKGCCWQLTFPFFFRRRWTREIVVEL